MTGLSNQFWNTYFPELTDDEFDERDALQLNFWENLKDSLEAVDTDTVNAVMLSMPIVKITNNNMYTEIVRIAKRV